MLGKKSSQICSISNRWRTNYKQLFQSESFTTQMFFFQPIVHSLSNHLLWKLDFSHTPSQYWSSRSPPTESHDNHSKSTFHFQNYQIKSPPCPQIVRKQTNQQFQSRSFVFYKTCQVGNISTLINFFLIFVKCLNFHFHRHQCSFLKRYALFCLLKISGPPFMQTQAQAEDEKAKHNFRVNLI